MYAAVKGGGFDRTRPKLFKTTDRGVTWHSLTPNIDEINVIAIHPTDHNTIYLGADDGIYLSKDSGKTLEKLKSARSIISLEIQNNNLDIIYASSASIVLKSDDGGKTWNDITWPLDDIHHVRVSRSNPDILYAATFNGVFRSDDAGNTWKDKTGNLKAKNFQIVSIHPTNPDIAFAGTSSLWSSSRSEERYKGGLLAHQGIYKTADGGNSWAKSDTGIFDYNIEEVAVNQNKPFEAWYAGIAGRGALKTNDAGQNWRLTQIQTMHYPMRIKFSMQNPDKVYGTSWHSSGPFAISEDGGINWDLIQENAFFNGINRGKSLYKLTSPIVFCRQPGRAYPF